MSNHIAEAFDISARGRPDEEHRRGETESTLDGMEEPAGFQESQRLLRSTITTRIEQPIVRSANREQITSDLTSVALPLAETSEKPQPLIQLARPGRHR
jgi:hypothetical protein